MDYTQNYKLKKPSYDDPADVADLNENADKIDGYLKAAEQSAEHMGEELNDHIADTTAHITAEERAAWNAKAETDTATSTANGLMSAADKKKLDGIATGANKYSLPLATASVRGGAKIGYKENGKNYPVELSDEKMFVNVPWENTTYTTFVKSGSGAKSGLVPAPSTTAGTTKYLREDGTWAVPPDTTYGEVTQSTAGLMSAADKKKLDGIATGATKVVVDSALSTSSTNPVQNKIVTANINNKMDKVNPIGSGSLSIGRDSSSTVGDYSSAVGTNVVASGYASHAEGHSCSATEHAAHSEGYNTKSIGVAAHSEGGATFSYANFAHTQNHGNKAAHQFSSASGQYNITGRAHDFAIGILNKQKADSLFTIGAGSVSSSFDSADCPDTMDLNEYARSVNTLKNAFRVNSSGAVYGVGAYNTSGADYAEYIKEWADGNPEGEDRRGYFVTVKDGKLCKAESGDYIVGITSGNPSIIGNADEDWLRRWQRDEFNSLIYKEVEVPDFEEQVDENGNIKTVKVGSHTEMQTVENPDYDKTLPYVERKDRPEWSAVGMIGILPLRDDGTCEAGGFAKCGAGGIATKADTYDCHNTFFVVERISESVISVEMR